MATGELSLSARRLLFAGVLCLLLWAGMAARWHALTDDVRFHVDEALFATFARGAAVQGDWMLPGALDKPPLTLYAQALSMHLTGVSVNESGVLDLTARRGEFSARLPATLGGMLMMALGYALARRLTRSRRAGMYACALIALSPFMIAYSATAFTDGLMLTAGLGALLMAAYGRGGWAGVWLAVSIACKQQGVFYLPLIAVLLWDAVPAGKRRQVFTRAGVTLMIGAGLLIAWDIARPETSLFVLASVNNDPQVLLAEPQTLLERAGMWGVFIGGLFGAGWWVIFSVGARGAWRVPRPPAGVRAVTLFITAYLILHWALAFNLYDRYLILIAPLIGVVGAWAVACGTRRRMTTAITAVLLCAGVMLAPAGWRQDDRWRDDAILLLADEINGRGMGAIVYDPWLGWYNGYYLGAWSDKRRVHYPSAQAFATDAPLNPDRAPRYLVAPQNTDYEHWLGAITAQGFTVTEIITVGRFVLIEITPAGGLWREL